MLKTEITWFGRRCLLTCDHKCEFAWGIDACHVIDPNGFSRSIEYDEDDDNVLLADHEIDPNLRMPDYLGGRPETHGKWCARECERSTIIEAGEPIRYLDFSKRHYNQPWKHPEADLDPYIYTGEVFTPKSG
jgi:hypothetical protein